jgi:hypothetical protein
MSRSSSAITTVATGRGPPLPTVVGVRRVV